MRRHARVLAGLALTASAIALAAGPASAGKLNPITYDPNPVPAGTSTTATGTCPSEAASFVTITFSLELSDSTSALISIDIDVDPQTATFSGAIDIPANAIVQTVTTEGTCIATDDGEYTVGFLQGDLSVSEAPPPPTTTAPSTTTTVAASTTTTVATTAPSTTFGPVTLPNTGSSSSNGPVAAIAAGALAVGIALIFLARRRSADV